MKLQQIEWRRKSPLSQEPGEQNKRYYEHILPRSKWEENLWPGIAGALEHSLPTYLKNGEISKHTGSHNLLSSWIMCANLYYPFRSDAGRSLLLGFLQKKVSREITEVTGVELEHQFGDPALTPAALLGETDGSRGSGQTSPDVAFEVATNSGKGVILTECKFTEHFFYPCSGRDRNAGGRGPNPDRTRCDNALRILADPSDQCHLYRWGRRYWDYLAPIVNLGKLGGSRQCPAATAGYQLFRQQALAEALANSGHLAYVASAVAYDGRNQALMHSLARSTGIDDIPTGWPQLFHGGAAFSVFTHQEWVAWVAEEALDDHYSDWLRYVRDRYQL